MAKKISGSVGKGSTNSPLPLTIMRLREAGLTTLGARQAASGLVVTDEYDRLALARFLNLSERFTSFSGQTLEGG